MQRRIYFLIVLFCFFAFQFSKAQTTSIGRQRLLMGFNWRFSQTDTVGADKTEFNDSKWRTLNLPHDWSIENEFLENAPTTGRGGYLPTGVGWYRKHFALPKSASAKNVCIEFDGVYQRSDRCSGRYDNRCRRQTLGSVVGRKLRCTF